MGARFSQGTNERSTSRLTQRSPPSNPAKMSKTRQGMPGYIKTKQDASDSGLAHPAKARGGSIGAPNINGNVPKRKGEPRKNWQAASSTGGSQDVSYLKTSTDSPGTIRKGGMPKAPASRSKSEMETTPGGTKGSKGAVALGGALGANKMPAGGAKGGPAAKHIPGSGHRGLGSRNAAGTGKQLATRNSGAGRGTMESLRGKMKMGGRKASW